MAGVVIMISWAAKRPPCLRFTKTCEMTAFRDSESMALTMSFSAAGNTSTILSMVLVAELVCKVAKTKCPVSAAVNAKRMLVKSLNSPITITSGSSLKAERNAVSKFKVC